ncbi:MAG: hypothetical protein WAS50_16940, partial [Nitrospira sp.]
RPGPPPAYSRPGMRTGEPSARNHLARGALTPNNGAAAGPEAAPLACRIMTQTPSIQAHDTRLKNRLRPRCSLV